MLLEVALSEIMVKVPPKIYWKYVIMIRKEKQLRYDQIQKALYGLLHSELMFYRKVVNDLEAYGFHINIYDQCVAKHITNNKQMTLVWHVDDLKVSHLDIFEITKFAGYISSI